MNEKEALDWESGYQLTPPAKLDFGQSFMESPLLHSGTWFVNASVPYLADPLAEFAQVTFRNSADEQVGPTWDIPVASRHVTLLQVNFCISLLTETKLRILVDGLTLPEAEINYLRLRP